jgi:hypothetical protein
MYKPKKQTEILLMASPTIKTLKDSKKGEEKEKLLLPLSLKQEDTLTNLHVPFNSEAEELFEKNKLKERRVFKNADEMINTLFPNLEKQVGKNWKDDYKWGLPLGSMFRLETPLTEEQKQEYKKLLAEKSEEFNAVCPDPGRILSIEESIERLKKGRIVHEYYQPKFINIMTLEQQLQFAQQVQKRVFDEKEREQKEAGKELFIDTIDELEKMKGKTTEELEEIERQREKTWKK